MQKRRFGDRCDGRRIRTLDPLFTLVPYIMRTRLDSQNLFEFDVPLGGMENYLHEKRRQGYKKMSILHIFMAAAVRMFSQKPVLNRFIAGNRIYARNSIQISIAIKKQMTEDAEETTLKIDFEPTDTLFEVYEKLNAEIEKNKGEGASNDTDATAKIVSMLPPFIMRMFVGVVRKFDAWGIMPKALVKVSPFHSSLFVTDLGSLGIQPVYHHLYEFGTVTEFVSFGIKHRKLTLDKDGNAAEEKYISFRVTSDERICDGFAFAVGFRLLRSLLLHPERLEQPPEHVAQDIP